MDDERELSLSFPTKLYLEQLRFCHVADSRNHEIDRSSVISPRRSFNLSQIIQIYCTNPTERRFRVFFTTKKVLIADFRGFLYRGFGPCGAVIVGFMSDSPIPLLPG